MNRSDEGAPAAEAQRRVEVWLSALERRALGQVTFSELARSIRALSAWYVEKRDRLGSAQVFGGAGKRAAFASYYGPLHFLLVRSLIGALPPFDTRPQRIVDLGCGTGVAGAALSLAFAPPVDIVAGDASPWPVKEAGWTLATLGLSCRVRCMDVLQVPLGGKGTSIVAAFCVNELGDTARSRLLTRLQHAIADGAHVLIVEPIARSPLPWWDVWAEALATCGASAQEWRWPAVLPDWLIRLDRAAHLHHDTLTCRSLSV